MTVAPLRRRQFMGSTGVALAACATCVGGVAGCFAENTAARPVTAKPATGGRLSLGPAGDLAVGDQLKVSAPGLDEVVLVARVSDTEVRAVALNCTHFGSEVTLVLGEERFHCPSHGSAFAYDGSVLEGPASDPLNRYEVIEKGGELFMVVPPAAG